MEAEVDRVSAGELRSGKGHKDENFPVASLLVAAKYRAPILAFYRFARVPTTSQTIPICRRRRSWLCSIRWRRASSARAARSRRASRCAAYWRSAAFAAARA
jgi:hypothetical protein